MALKIDTIEKWFAVLVVAMILVQLGAMLANNLGFANNIKFLGTFFILASFAAAAIIAYIVLVSRGLNVRREEFVGIFVVVLMMGATVLFLPRVLPGIFDQSTLDGLRGIGLLSAAPFDLGAATPVVNGFNSVVTLITPFFALLVLLGVAIWAHYNKKLKGNWKVLTLGLVSLLFVIVSLTQAYTKTFGV